MNEHAIDKPVVLAVNSNDPTGGGGIAADIETMASIGCHCAPVISAICARDTTGIKDRQALDAATLVAQLRSALEDMPVRLVKIGDVGSVANAEALHTVLTDYPQLAIVLDPVLSAEPDADPTLTPQADGTAMVQATRMLLQPLATVTVLSHRQLWQMAAQADAIGACAQALLQFGGDHLLITGQGGSGGRHLNQLFTLRGLSRNYEWTQHPGDFHGAGSTLSAALAAYLAHGFSLPEAVSQAQQFTWEALACAHRVGMGHKLPDRLHWSRRQR